ncbi:hypothetical protein GQ42DRAFT_90029 [Ramicandelaber brevisporus]|nr:hypothetical protein GQ42DRAFT_90029 [Ramicandelaber brevisporus]
MMFEAVDCSARFWRTLVPASCTLISQEPALCFGMHLFFQYQRGSSALLPLGASAWDSMGSSKTGFGPAERTFQRKHARVFAREANNIRRTTMISHCVPRLLCFVLRSVLRCPFSHFLSLSLAFSHFLSLSLTFSLSGPFTRWLSLPSDARNVLCPSRAQSVFALSLSPSHAQ